MRRVKGEKRGAVAMRVTRIRMARPSHMRMAQQRNKAAEHIFRIPNKGGPHRSRTSMWYGCPEQCPWDGLSGAERLKLTGGTPLRCSQPWCWYHVSPSYNPDAPKGDPDTDIRSKYVERRPDGRCGARGLAYAWAASAGSEGVGYEYWIETRKTTSRATNTRWSTFKRRVWPTIQPQSTRIGGQLAIQLTDGAERPQPVREAEAPDVRQGA
ncbi:hypothetical protein V8E36_003515 [Tilletia maclaganii]